MKAFKMDTAGVTGAVWPITVVLDTIQRRAIVRLAAYKPDEVLTGEPLAKKDYTLAGDAYPPFLAAVEAGEKSAVQLAIDHAKAKKDVGPATARVSYFEKAEVVEIPFPAPPAPPA